MPFFNKTKRIKYLGFNDMGFMVVGIIILGFVVDFLISGSFFRHGNLLEALVNSGISLTYSTLNWLTMRSIIIALRKNYPTIKDNKKRIPLILLFIVISVITIDAIGNTILGLIFNESYNHPLRSKIILPVIVVSTMTMAIYEAIYYYIQLKKSIRDEEEAKRTMVQAQLDALRNQAQPHFFFNTLNTLRDIIDQNTKEEAKEFVNRLSEVYRFILESGNANLITLSEELRFAEAYLHIQKERFGDNLQVQWKIEENVKGHFIIPMSLQLLLENAVKHNVVSKTVPLQVSVSVENGFLVVHNKMRPKSTQLPTTGLGLQNIERRYALVAETEITITKDDGHFTVKLPLLPSKS